MNILNGLVGGVAWTARCLLPSHPHPGSDFKAGVPAEDVEIGLKAAKWSQESYDVSEQAQCREGWTFIDTKNDTQVLVGPSDDGAAVVVAVRGTADLADAVEDMEVLKKKAAAFEGTVHTGFLSCFKSSCPAIDEAVMNARKKYATNNLIVTGHSLGAAIGTLYAIHAAKDGPVSLVTFGSPRVGDPQFADTTNENKLVSHHRWVHQSDIVPTLPPTALGYKHTGLPRIMSPDGTFYTTGNPEASRGYVYSTAAWLDDLQQDGISARLQDHHLTNYIASFRSYQKAHGRHPASA